MIKKLMWMYQFIYRMHSNTNNRWNEWEQKAIICNNPSVKNIGQIKTVQKNICNQSDAKLSDFCRF